MGQSLLAELLSHPAETSVLMGSILYFFCSLGFLIVRHSCRSCGKILLDTGESTGLQQIMGRWLFTRYRIQLCGNLNCPAPIHVRAKSRPATKAEILRLGTQ